MKNKNSSGLENIRNSKKFRIEEKGVLAMLEGSDRWPSGYRLQEPPFPPFLDISWRRAPWRQWPRKQPFCHSFLFEAKSCAPKKFLKFFRHSMLLFRLFEIASSLLFEIASSLLFEIASSLLFEIASSL